MVTKMLKLEDSKHSKCAALPPTDQTQFDQGVSGRFLNFDRRAKIQGFKCVSMTWGNSFMQRVNSLKGGFASFSSVENG